MVARSQHPGGRLRRNPRMAESMARFHDERATGEDRIRDSIAERKNQLPMKKRKYLPGMGRNDGEESLVTHLYEYKGTISNILGPMCRKGWNRSDGSGFSILRNNVSNKGICRTCQKRAGENLPFVESVPGSHKTKYI